MSVVGTASTRPLEMATNGGSRDLAEECRAAGPGQHDPDIGVTRCLAQELGRRIVGASGDLAPGIGLLSDLENGCTAVFLGGHRFRHSVTPLTARA